MMFLVVVTAILASALAQSPHCCSITQYESGMRILSASYNSTSGEALRERGFANLTYDYENGRSYFSYRGMDDSGGENNYQVINLYNENLRYEISEGACSSSQPSRAMTSNCIPAGAKARQPTYLGQFGDHLSARSYVFQSPASPNVRVAVLTNQECFPLNIRTSGSDDNVIERNP